MAYPPSLPPDNRQDGPGNTVFASDHNDLVKGVQAILDELGSGPKGSDSDLTARLAALEIAPKELGYAEITTSFVSTPGVTTATDVPGLSVTVTVGTRPILVVFDAGAISHILADKLVAVIIAEGATGLTSVLWTSPSANSYGPCHREYRPDPIPSAGSHTYKVQLLNVDGSTNAAITADPASPAFIQVLEL